MIRHFSLVIVLAATLSASQVIIAQEKPIPVQVQVQVLEATPFSETLKLSGAVNSLQNAQISVSADALVAKVLVDVGSQVTRGDVLLELDASLAELQHQRALAELNAAETTHAETKRLYDEALQMKQQSHISASEVSARESALKVAAAGMAQARAEVNVAGEQLARHRLHAPFDGVISERWAELGQWINRGDPAFALVSLDNLRMDVKLPQEYLPKIEYLKQVEIHPDPQPELAIAAQMDTLVPVGDISRSFLLRLKPATDSSLVTPGISAQAHLRFEYPKTAVLLPRDALLRNADGDYSVFVIENQKASRRKLKLNTANRDGYLVQEGVKAGERVVVRGNEILRDGQSVNVVESQP